MTNHQKGYRRDRLVLETVAEWGCMDTEQLLLLCYPSARVARRRLRILTERGRLRRTREALEQPFAYYVTKYDPTRLALNWARLWLQGRLKSWEVMESFDYSGLATIRNTVTGAVRSVNVLYNAARQTWVAGDAVIVYDTDQQRQAAAKKIRGELLTIDEVREGLKCSAQRTRPGSAI